MYNFNQNGTAIFFQDLSFIFLTYEIVQFTAYNPIVNVAKGCNAFTINSYIYRYSETLNQFFLPPVPNGFVSHSLDDTFTYAIGRSAKEQSMIL